MGTALKPEIDIRRNTWVQELKDLVEKTMIFIDSLLIETNDFGEVLKDKTGQGKRVLTNDELNEVIETSQKIIEELK